MDNLSPFTEWAATHKLTAPRWSLRRGATNAIIRGKLAQDAERTERALETTTAALADVRHVLADALALIKRLQGIRAPGIRPAPKARPQPQVYAPNHTIGEL